MRHGSDVPARRQIARSKRTVGEVEIHDAGRLLETERHLEAADLQLERADGPDVREDVPPGTTGIAHVPLHLVFHVPRRPAIDDDACARHIEHVVRIGGLLREVAPVSLRLEMDVEPEVGANPKRRILLE